MNDLVKVDSQDTLVAAVDDANSRARNIFGSGMKTLIETISQQDWDTWDASEERPNVADSASLSSDDDSDEWAPIAA